MIGIDFVRDFAVILAVAAAVGWGCHRAGIPVIAGYLVAGMVIGPNRPSLAWVSDVERIQAFSQVGLVFVMFGVGLRLSVRKFQRMGLGIFAAVIGGALLVYYLAKLLGASLGMGGVETMFFAAMIMISSSKVIARILQELGMLHERPGQIALGMTVLEGVVAILALTLLNSYAQFGANAVRAPLGEVLGELSAFVALAVIAALLLIPWLLHRVTNAMGEELQTISLVAVLLALAIVARYAGFSLALGAFILGAVVAETPHRHQVVRKFDGLRDLFGAVFFVAMGMLVDLRVAFDHLGLIAGVALFTIVARGAASAIALILVGTPLRDAYRVGLTLTPIGEFSFVIAQLGVSALLVPAYFFPLAVGVSLITLALAPVLTRHADAVSLRLVALAPRWFDDSVGHYHNWIERLQARRKRNLLWQLSKKRIIQVSVSVLLISGLLVFSERLLKAYTDWLGRDFLVTDGLVIVFWIVLSLVALAPLVAMWRNLSAMALLYSQVATHGMPRKAQVRPLLEAALKTVAGIAIYIWLSSLLPTHGAGKWLVVVSVAVAIVGLLILRRKLIYWHSELEGDLREMLASGEAAITQSQAAWLRPHVDWNLKISECVLPDLAECQGKRIAQLDLRARFGCTVVGIERQGYLISLPSPRTALYPRDKVLLLGTDEQVAAGKTFLTTVSELSSAASEFDEIRMELIPVPAWSRANGLTLLEISPAANHRVQIAGIYRAGSRILTPGADETVKAGDELLALGAPDHLRDFKTWLQEEAGTDIGDGTGG